MHDYYTILSKYLSGEASPEEAVAMDEWIQASPANRQLFDQCFSISEAAASGTYSAPDPATGWTAVSKAAKPGAGFGRNGLFLASVAGIVIVSMVLILFNKLSKDSRIVKHNRSEKNYPKENKASGSVQPPSPLLATFSFRNTYLSEAFDSIEKAYGIAIIVPPKTFDSCRVTAFFDNKELEEVMTILSFTLKFKYEASEDGKRFFIRGEGCN